MFYHILLITNMSSGWLYKSTKNKINYYNCISGTTHHNNRCLKLSTWSKMSAYILLKIGKICLLKTNETGCIVV